MKQILTLIIVVFLFVQPLLSQTTNGQICAIPDEWQELVDSLEKEGLQLHKMDLLTSDTTGGRYKTIYVSQDPYVDLQPRRLPGLQETETMVKSVERWTKRLVPVVHNPDIPQEVKLEEVWQRTTSITRYTYLVEQQYYVWNVITSHYFEWEKPPAVGLRSVSCPAPDPLTEVIFTGTTNAAAETTYNGTFRPTYESDHAVTIDDISLTGSDPFTVFQGSVVSLKNSLEGAGSGILVPEVDEISDVAYCHSECQQQFNQYGHVCNGYDPISRFITLVGPLGLCFTPGGPIEVTGTGGSTDPFILSLQINMTMIMSDAASNWGHFQDLSACAYASGMGVGFYAGTSGTVTCNWVNITGNPPCATSPISCSTVLPLELAYFGIMSSTYDQPCAGVELGWGVATSLNADYVKAECSIDGSFLDARVVGMIESDGDHSELVHYTIVDEDPPKSGILYYRLKMVDLDGTVKYSDIISKNREACQKDLETSSLSIYPNPFSAEFSIKGMISGQEFEIFDVVGKSIVKQTYTEEQVFLNLQSGIYFLRVLVDEENVETVRIVKH